MADHDILTKREKEILQFIAEGDTDKVIATKLTISATTVSTHRKNILRKLKLKNTAMLVSYAIRNKIV